MCSIRKKHLWEQLPARVAPVKMFFSLLAFPFLPWDVCLFLVWFPLYILIWTLTSVPSPGCLSQTAVQRCDNAFFLPVPFMTFFSSSFCSFFLFFPFQGLAHLTLNDQGMGSFLFYFGSVFRGTDSALFAPKLLLSLTVSSSAFYLPSVPYPTISPQILLFGF